VFCRSLPTLSVNFHQSGWCHIRNTVIFSGIFFSRNHCYEHNLAYFVAEFSADIFVRLIGLLCKASSASRDESSTRCVLDATEKGTYFSCVIIGVSVCRNINPACIGTLRQFIIVIMVCVNITCAREKKIMNMLGREGAMKRERERSALFMLGESRGDRNISCWFAASLT